MQAVILAAGRGTRLHPITLSRSKATAPVAGKPMIGRVIESLAACGIEEWIVVAHPDDKELAEYLRERLDVPGAVRIGLQAERLGTAHALMQAAPLIHDSFILSACDSIVPAAELGRMCDTWRASPALDGLLALLPASPDAIMRGAAVSMHGPWITRIIEKPGPGDIPSGMASLPLYCFAMSILDYLPAVPLSPRGEYELQDAIQLAIDKGAKLLGSEFSQRLALTNATDLLALNCHFLARSHKENRSRRSVLAAGTKVIQPVQIGAGSSIGASCTIGPDVYLEGGCQLGDRVTLRRAVVLRGAEVPSGATIKDRVVT